MLAAGLVGDVSGGKRGKAAEAQPYRGFASSLSFDIYILSGQIQDDAYSLVVVFFLGRLHLRPVHHTEFWNFSSFPSSNNPVLFGIPSSHQSLYQIARHIFTALPVLPLRLLPFDRRSIPSSPKPRSQSRSQSSSDSAHKSSNKCQCVKPEESTEEGQGQGA